MVLCHERRSRTNRRAAVWQRGDGELALYQLDSFAHASEPQTASSKGSLLVEANAIVSDSELNLRLGSFEFRCEVPHAAAFDRILQGFLQDPEQAKRDLLGYAAGHTFVSKVNLHLLLFGEFSAETK
jgi:hypothetical protein